MANACTGEEGYGYCKETAKIAAESLQIPEDSVLVASTGVIGKQLPMDLLGAGIKNLVPLLSHTREGRKTGSTVNHDHRIPYRKKWQ